jgi:diguanylate cyclase (GGDEF)-like protein
MLHQTNNELRRQKILLNTAVENISQGLCMFDANGRIMLFNEQYAKWMDLPAASLGGMSLLDVIESRKASGKFIGDPQVLFKSVVDSAREGKSSTRIIETLGNRALRVIERPMQEGGWVATSEDITDSRKTQEQISYLAHHDALTGLWNRTTLIERLENALAILPFSRGKIAVHFVDIDHLKWANDTLGHDGGDLLLKTVAERLKSVTRVGDAAARIGGDEFIVVQTEVNDVDVAKKFAKRLSAALSAPMKLKEQTISATASVGVALAPEDGTSPERLLKSADLALYKAKADGRNCIRFFQAEMNTNFEARFKLEAIVREAVLHNQFELYYQPIVDISRHRLVGFEALIRLRSEGKSFIPPLVFIPVAEDLQLINEITAWVLRDACRAAASWPEHLIVAVNLSPAQFWLGSISEDVAAALKEAGLPADRLELEITETQLLAHTEAILAELLTVKAMGVAIVMDDFGTGYSSLSYLWRFPFDKIKIDRCFMQDFVDSNRDVKTVVKTIIALGRELDMRVTIEGVETAAQVAFLEEVDGDQAQGYFFGRPVPASELSAIILAEFRDTRLRPTSAEAATMPSAESDSACNEKNKSRLKRGGV